MRDRVCGIETEYVLIYRPSGGETWRPSGLELYEMFQAALQRRVRTLPRAFSLLRPKLGCFLENGASFDFEASSAAFQDGLVEMASPECRDPETLVTYERAKDELMQSLAEDVNRFIWSAGYAGRVTVSKSCVDSEGHTFGSHENYWIEDPLPHGSLALLVPTWLALWAVTAPVLLATLLGLFAVPIGLPIVALIRRRVRSHGLAGRWIDRTGMAALGESILDAAQSGRFEKTPGLNQLLPVLHGLFTPLYALVRLHSLAFDLVHIRAFRRHLTAFLVTRGIFAGAGTVSFDGGPLFRLTQRSEFMRTVSGVFIDGNTRPIFETRDGFLHPLSVFRRRRRLHLFVGDANLSEHALFLRVGTTLLVLEAIESGAWTEGPRLAAPLDALVEIGRDESLGATVALVDGRRATAIEIQRAYLRGVERALDASDLSGWRSRVLHAWRETLDRLERDPDSLRDRLDWVAKRTLVRAELDAPEDLEELHRRGRAVLAGTAPADRPWRELAYRIWRADLRYHELGPRGGQRRLESLGKMRRLTDPESVRRAQRDPPDDTRARARGLAIRGATDPDRGAAEWHRIRTVGRRWKRLDDPLDPELPAPPSG